MCYLAMQKEYKKEYEAIEKLLKESHEAVHGAEDKTDALLKEKAQTYGQPEDFFSQLATAKEAITGIPTSPSREVGYMILFKTIRFINNPNYQDTLDDIEGYARIAKRFAQINEDKEMKKE
jgi:hypothetical protein